MEASAMIQKYISYLSEIGFSPVDTAGKPGNCGFSYHLDSSVGKGDIWGYGVDKLYGIVVSDFVFDCNVHKQFEHSPFFSIGLGTFNPQKQMQKGNQQIPSLFTYVGHDDVFQGKFEKGDIVRGVTVSFLPDFYNDYLPGRYPKISNLKNIFTAINNNNAIPGVTGVLHQLGRFRPSRNIARMYYDSKVTELISMMMQWEINMQSLPANNRIPDCDMDNLHWVMEYLNKHYTQDIYLKTLTHHAGMSQTKLTSLFSQVYGTTISDHIRNLRITLAKEMLADDKLKIEAIANTVGYRFHGNFSAAFKDSTGLTPRQYRKTLL